MYTHTYEAMRGNQIEVLVLIIKKILKRINYKTQTRHTMCRMAVITN